MKRIKLVVFIATILLSGIAAVFTYAAHNPFPGSTMIAVTNPPDTSKTWKFLGTSIVNVYFENLSKTPAYLTVNCVNTSTDTEYYVLLPYEMTSTMSYRTISYAYIEWAFTIQISNLAQIMGYASWN